MNILGVTFILIVALFGISAAMASAQPAEPADSSQVNGETRIAVVFTGGHDTDPRDRGRPVVLVASALGVAPQVFRDAFSHVKPAGPGQTPEPAQVRLNKQALMDRLEPYGVTNDRLDEVSNYYRYVRSRGELWRHAAATAYATVRKGVVTGIVITNPGSGYSSAPQISVPGMPGVQAKAALAFGTDFQANGSVKEIKLGNNARAF